MSWKRNNSAVVAYVPTPHAGYIKFFRSYTGEIFYLVNEWFIYQFKSLVRNLPAVTPEEALRMIRSLGIFSDVRFLSSTTIDDVRKKSLVIMPDEDVSHAIAEKYLKNVQVSFDGCWRLRWDWGNTQKKLRPNTESVVSKCDIDCKFMRNAINIAEKSPDWWRQIGALLVKNGNVLLSSFNQHMPHEQSGYCFGDPRSNFEQGQSIDLSIALHAEIGIISESARRGISMEGCDLYVTTFPCPPCARAVANTGIKRLFYADGYSLVEGAETLQSRDIEIVRVEM